MRLYFDTCCLMRRFDDQSQPTIHLETVAVDVVLERIRLNRWRWVAGPVLWREVNACPHEERRRDVLALLEFADEMATFDADAMALARRFVNNGLDMMDAAHLASAELARCDRMFTTDVDFLKRCRKMGGKLHVQVMNPTEAAMEEWK